MHPSVACLVRSSGQVAIVVVLKNTLPKKFFKAIVLIQAKSAGLVIGAIETTNRSSSKNLYEILYEIYMSFIDFQLLVKPSR